MERDGYDMRSKSNFAGCWVHFPVGGDTPQGCSGWWRHTTGVGECFTPVGEDTNRGRFGFRLVVTRPGCSGW